MTKKEAFDIGLPKWPQMRVIGEKVPVELAEEIILRTDDFFGPFSGGNNHQFDKAARKLFIGYEECPDNWEEKSKIRDRQEELQKKLENEADGKTIKVLEDMLAKEQEKLNELVTTPASALGSCRKKLPDYTSDRSVFDKLLEFRLFQHPPSPF